MTGAATSRPAAHRLTISFDADALANDLTALIKTPWRQLRVQQLDGVGPAVELDWTVLPLRSPGGDPNRTDPGSPGREMFAATPHLERVPAMAAALAAIPAPMNAARLMALGPGATGYTHSDPKYDLARGLVRLHVPIITNPDAILVLDGITHRWQAGELWCGEFARPHRVENHGVQPRVHLVIDAAMTTALAGLFAPHDRRHLDHGVVFSRPVVRPAPRIDCEIDLPASFCDYTENPIIDPRPTVLARITGDGISTVLEAGELFFLDHVGTDGTCAPQFRLSGWTDQRTLTLHTDHAILRVRDGRATRQATLPLTHRRQTP